MESSQRDKSSFRQCTRSYKWWRMCWEHGFHLAGQELKCLEGRGVLGKTGVCSLRDSTLLTPLHQQTPSFQERQPKIISKWRLRKAIGGTRLHILLEGIEIGLEPFLLSSSENSLHSSLSQNHRSSSIIPIIWCFYCSYRSFTPYSGSQLNVQTQFFLRFFLIPSYSFPEAPKDIIKGKHSLQASFEPIPAITMLVSRFLWGKIKIFL